MTNLLASLRAAIGDTHVLTDSQDTAPYLSDWRGRYQGIALCVVLPGTTDEVAAVVRLCDKANVPMVPQGGNTGLCGGSIPVGGEVVISLKRLNRVRELDAANCTITVEAGCSLHQVQQAAAAEGLLFPLSIASEGTATIGGNLSTNAGGVQVLRYGNTRDLALGLEVVLADGTVWNGLRGLRKDNTGYDLKHLFIGAEGTLGLVTSAVMKLFPRPRQQSTAWVGVESPLAAVNLLTHLKGDFGDRITAFELIGATALDMVIHHIPGSRKPLQAIVPWQVLVELSDSEEVGLDEALQNSLANTGTAMDSVIAQSEAQRAALWRLRESISEAQRIEGFSIKHDISVPVSKIAEFISTADAALEAAFPGVRIVCFGHVGDGNLHYNQSQPVAVSNKDFIARSDEVNKMVHDIVHSLNGSISAEHGLGQLKRTEILRYKSGTEIELMRAVKKALDPKGLMNPGKVV